ncbi:ATP-grasp domain-containing protein [Clostridium botulinum]|uniref:Carboxylate--amine ligase n=1 Tax=Clostridium botulinum TaxID=1491 RepID=A0A9Q1V0Q2_CLOBO|nr:ATP-grasp domain-containing protein [Clostridium botulinum]AEB75795.1 hypothetical protein CbC4_1115 [Clostridium botulinum BKT015925]KEH98585.1 carboxylate--amine ligase [Clostridium botulinum D str. 16868]KEI05751.1 carboxylate--amine ligase [Clostridium botulinum C/D str. Sp77]KLU75628.1 carboxylate--amine ligase [Clostridium botulinum V891]KOA75299.1 carboxylate--amine ligase [Clostridium botulinum]
MKKNLNVLLTASSGPGAVGIISALKSHPTKKICVITGSVEEFQDVSLKMSEKHIKIPFASDKQFVEKMITICKENDIQLIVPAYCEEIVKLAEYEKNFLKEGINILCPSNENICIAHNKDLLYENMKKDGVKYYPRFEIVSSVDELKKACLSMGYPEQKICVKPAVCNGGSRGFYLLDESYDRLKMYFEEKQQPVCSLEELLLKFKGLDEIPKIIVMEYLGGSEYGIDVVAKDGRVISSLIRKRLSPQIAGIDMRVKVEEKEELNILTQEIVEKFQLNSIVNIDVRYDSNMEKAYVLEINPRQSAYIGTSSKKVNLLAMSIDLKLGEKIHIDTYKTNHKEVMGIRYFGEFTICDEKLVLLEE